MSEDAPPKNNTGLMIGIGCVAFFFVFPMIGIFAAVIIPSFFRYQHRLKHVESRVYNSKHSEAQMHLQAIRTAELAYHAEHDVYLSVSPYPLYVGKEKYAWNPAASGKFQTLGWAPDGYARGSYSVTTTGDNFQVIGILDVDGDGHTATYIATKSSLPIQVTEEDVY